MYGHYHHGKWAHHGGTLVVPLGALGPVEWTPLPLRSHYDAEEHSSDLMNMSRSLDYISTSILNS